MKRILLLFTVSMLLIVAANAQNTINRCAFGVNWAVTDFYGPDGGGFYKAGHTNMHYGPVNFTFAYNLVKPLNLATSISFYKIFNINRQISDDFMWKWDAGVQFRFLSFLNDEAAIDPYLYVNGGVMQIDKAISPLVNGGLGINLWVTDNIALSTQSGYNYGIGSEKFYETTFGLKIRLGGKDSDHDGIVDSKDDCPNVFGTKKNNGCPEEKPVVINKEEIKEKLNFSAKNIHFETSSATIKPSSYKDLDNIVAILKKYPDLKITIDGYTDNTGNPDSNLKLSQDRANSVRRYFINKGINPDRITAIGHGSADPVASNDTPEGRAKNRRVEINIVE